MGQSIKLHRQLSSSLLPPAAPTHPTKERRHSARAHVHTQAGSQSSKLSPVPQRTGSCAPQAQGRVHTSCAGPLPSRRRLRPFDLTFKRGLVVLAMRPLPHQATGTQGLDDRGNKGRQKRRTRRRRAQGKKTQRETLSFGHHMSHHKKKRGTRQERSPSEHHTCTLGVCFRCSGMQGEQSLFVSHFRLLFLL